MRRVDERIRTLIVGDKYRDKVMNLMDAVASRNAFAAAHSAYTKALKNAGAALSEYGQAEMVDFLHPNTSSSSPSAIASSYIALG